MSQPVARTLHAVPSPAPAAASAPARSGARLIALFEELRDELLGVASGIVRNRDDAVDVLQEAFLKCWQRRDQTDEGAAQPVRNLRGWIFTVLVNTARDEQRRRQRRPAVALEVDVAGPREVPAKGIEHGELVGELRKAIAQLRDEDREVFLLRQNGELGYAEIASLLDIPEGTAKTRMRKALTRLRAVLERCEATRL